MTESQRIAEQLKLAFEGPAWHGPAVMQILAGVTAEGAAQKPLRAAHSIWEIVLHIAVWEDVARRRTLGEKAEPTDEEDWPAVADPSEVAWKTALQALEAGHRRLRATVEALEEARLSQEVTGRGYSLYVMLHGVVQHDLYHAGQIAILKKAWA